VPGYCNLGVLPETQALKNYAIKKESDALKNIALGIAIGVVIGTAMGAGMQQGEKNK
jgi:hypothetical protein